MPPTAPAPWRRAFDLVERVVAPPLERGLTSPEFARGAAVARRARRIVGRRVDATASWALHLAALPSHRDIRRLQRQLTSVERQLGALRRELDARNGSRR